MLKYYITLVFLLANSSIFCQDTLQADTSAAPANLETTEAIVQGKKIDLDSIASLSRLIELNTKPNYFNKEEWDALLILFAFFGAVGTILTWYSVREESQKKLLQKGIQKNILLDLIRHFFRNKIVLCAMQIKLEQEGFDKYYPSEEHLLKLKVLPEDQRFDKFNNIPKHYNELHKLELMFRNFSIEADVTLTHLMDSEMPKERKLDDLDTLEFKMEFLTRKILELMESLGFEQSTEEVAEFLQMHSNEYKGDKSKEKAEIEVPPRRAKRRYYDDDLELTEILSEDIKIEYPIIKLIRFH